MAQPLPNVCRGVPHPPFLRVGVLTSSGSLALISRGTRSFKTGIK